MERAPWDTDSHRERYRKVLMREIALEQALRENADEWVARSKALEDVVNLTSLEKQRAKARALLTYCGPLGGRAGRGTEG